jgi:hypothetical protein
MKTLLKLGAVIFLGLIALVYFSSKTDFAVFQNKVRVFSADMLSRKHRPASYHQWLSQLEEEWQGVRDELSVMDETSGLPLNEGTIKQYDHLFEVVMRDIKRDMKRAGGDVPQVLPQQ